MSRLRRGQVDVAELVAAARAGQPRAVAKLISLVENDSEQLAEVARELLPHTGHAQIVGVTGSPGVGKSTSTAALIASLRAEDRRVGVLAIDPSSPYSGGALLGDRIRMAAHSTDDGVFIRSMATRGHLGGLAAAAPQALRVLDAAGCDVILVETVGVGQAELEIATLADTTLVLLAPGMGDGVQAAKAGILEIADVLVVNKADRDGADQVARDLRAMQAMVAPGDSAAWQAPIVKIVAARGEGIDGVRDAIEEHRRWLEGSGELGRRRYARLAAEVEAIALAQVRRRLGEVRGSAAFTCAITRVASGDSDPYTAARDVLARLTN